MLDYDASSQARQQIKEKYLESQHVKSEEEIDFLLQQAHEVAHFIEAGVVQTEEVVPDRHRLHLRPTTYFSKNSDITDVTEDLSWPYEADMINNESGCGNGGSKPQGSAGCGCQSAK